MRSRGSRLPSLETAVCTRLPLLCRHALSQPGRLVRWTPDGKGYVVGGPGTLLLFELSGAAEPRALPHAGGGVT